MNARPRVVVLLATYDGLPYLPEQVASVLDQRDVDVRIVAGDDGSTDGTAQWLAQRAAVEPRLRLLPPAAPTGSPAANFYRLLVEAEVAPGELVGFADQDDVWYPDKLARGARALTEGYAAVSSDVVAFYPDGRREYIHKSFPQRRFDFVFESPGPGSSFLLTGDVVARCRAQLADPDGPMRAMTYHDWAVYALVRGAGLPWRILDTPTLDYRQHAGNVMGARAGLRAQAERVRLVTRRWHREQARLAAATAALAAPDGRRAELDAVGALLADTSLPARWRLARHAGDLRRRRRDQLALAAIVAGGLW